MYKEEGKAPTRMLVQIDGDKQFFFKSSIGCVGIREIA